MPQPATIATPTVSIDPLVISALAGGVVRSELTPFRRSSLVFASEIVPNLATQERQINERGRIVDSDTP